MSSRARGQLVKVEGVTEVPYNSRVYTLLAGIYSVTALNRLKFKERTSLFLPARPDGVRLWPTAFQK